MSSTSEDYKDGLEVSIASVGHEESVAGHLIGHKQVAGAIEFLNYTAADIDSWRNGLLWSKFIELAYKVPASDSNGSRFTPRSECTLWMKA